ncbi:MAG TPA: GNAT family N-acetyltransferase [Candidatus Saccharimonadales bacterium]|nr:GNAT family N-acetyltransferase [Candidatus Saccharimonadales bacterium]
MTTLSRASVPTDVTIRPLTADDLPALLDLVRAGRTADGATEPITLEDIRHNWFGDPATRLGTDTFGAINVGRLVGFCWVLTKDRPESAVKLFVAGEVHPDERRRGIGTELLRRADARANEVFIDHRAAVTGEVFVETPADNPGRQALFSDAGYRAVRTFATMRRSVRGGPPAVPDPPGFTFVQWRPELDDATRLAHNDAFRDHWGSDPTTRERWQHVVSGWPGFSRAASWLALDGDTVVGYTLCAAADPTYDPPRLGWLGTIGVRRDYRRRGLASALIARSLGSLRDVGADEAGLDVDIDNPSGAPRVYEALGFRIIRRSQIWSRTIEPRGT